MEAQQLREAVKQKMAEKGLSLAKLSVELGKKGASEGALSSYLNGKYAGDNDAIEQRLMAWIGINALRDELIEPSNHWIQTPTALEIYAALRYAHIKGAGASIFGVPGVGKTMTCQHYCSEQSGGSAWFLRANIVSDSPLGMYKQIARSLKISRPSTRKDELFDQLLAHLKDSKGVLVVDESQRLSFKTSEALRDLADEAEIGLVLCGDIRSYVRLTEGRNKVAYAPLVGRIDKTIEITRISKEDIAIVLDHWGIVDADQRELLGQTYHHGGALRVMYRVYRLACTEAIGAGEPLSVDHIKAAWEDRRIAMGTDS